MMYPPSSGFTERNVFFSVSGIAGQTLPHPKAANNTTPPNRCIGLPLTCCWPTDQPLAFASAARTRRNHEPTQGLLPPRVQRPEQGGGLEDLSQADLGRQQLEQRSRHPRSEHGAPALHGADRSGPLEDPHLLTGREHHGRSPLDASGEQEAR